MKRLARLIGREGYQLGFRMPRRINTRRNGIVTLQIDFRDFAVVDYNGTAIREAHVKEHIVSLIVLIAVTIDALALLPVVTGNLVVEDL